ncbi:unnamed protein product [Dibothriocephalus latus]|uniref:Uncharacterized protein n=1 Tax=Dibothriocephalus latus TaxID=60516 RepID=A0A3P7LWU7_DIBLA|nr:unnamed protein product [Dibothriocephalus latus]
MFTSALQTAQQTSSVMQSFLAPSMCDWIRSPLARQRRRARATVVLWMCLRATCQSLWGQHSLTSDAVTWIPLVVWVQAVIFVPVVWVACCWILTEICLARQSWPVIELIPTTWAVDVHVPDLITRRSLHAQFRIENAGVGVLV